MESLYLQTFVEVARTGSLTKAAETFRISQPTVTRRIKLLEDQYGFLLIDRSEAILSLTHVGRLVLESALKILEIEHELKSDLIQLEQKEGLAFACTPAFGIVHLQTVLKSFMQRQPKCDNFKIVMEGPTKIVEGLKSGAYELAVIEHCQFFDLSNFSIISLPSTEMVFTASPTLGIAETGLMLEQLFGQTLFCRDAGACSRTLLEENLGRLGYTTEKFSRIVVCDDIQFMIEALMRGEGIAFISTDLIRTHIETGQLKKYRVDGFTHQRKRTLASKAPVSGGNLASVFTEVIQKYFNDQAAPDMT